MSMMDRDPFSAGRTFTLRVPVTARERLAESGMADCVRPHRQADALHIVRRPPGRSRRTHIRTQSEEDSMPVFRSGKGLAPAWCELEYFDIVELSPGDSHTFERLGKKEKLIVAKGECTVSYGGETVSAPRGANLDLTAPDGAFKVTDVAAGTMIVRMCGRWGDEVGGSGVFGSKHSDNPVEQGDPTDYAKHTDLDNHYHDCDEYWIIAEGRGVAVTEGKHYEVGPGDCVATGMGHHHDIAEIYEPILGVWFETTLEGRNRLGHLWNHKHGTAEPQADRV
jgi:mannose-6-phosphate isomerase-like protein (cupin superfamily)